MKDYVFEGRVWCITDNNNTLIPDVDTDQIFHNAYLHITDVDQMGRYAFDNLEGWKDFASKAAEGDIIIAGPNFGAGSSRQHAVDCFYALGVKMVIAPSFGAIYKRNAINSGFPVLTSSMLEDLVKAKGVESGDILKVDILSGKIENKTKNREFTVNPFSKVQKDIYEKGSLLEM